MPDIRFTTVLQDKLLSRGIKIDLAGICVICGRGDAGTSLVVTLDDIDSAGDIEALAEATAQRVESEIAAKEARAIPQP